jgi:hypothetical protein
MLFIAGTSAALAQKNIHDANAVSRNVASFHGIQMSAGIDLYLSQSGTEGLAVSASNTEYRDKIVTEVVNGILKIYYEDKNSWGGSWSNRKMKAYVSVKEIDMLVASGGSDIFIDENLHAAKLKVQLSGGSDLLGKVVVEDLSVTASGGSDAKISGTATHLTVSISGGSDFKGGYLIADYGTISASGGSDIKYSGNPTTKNSSSGDGSVKRRN